MQTRQASRTAERAGRERHRNHQVVTAGVAGDHESRRHGAPTRASPGAPNVVVGSRTPRARAPKAKPVSFSSPVPRPDRAFDNGLATAAGQNPTALRAVLCVVGLEAPSSARRCVELSHQRLDLAASAASRPEAGARRCGGDCVIPGEDAFEARCPNGGLAEFENASVVSDRSEQHDLHPSRSALQSRPIECRCVDREAARLARPCGGGAASISTTGRAGGMRKAP